LAAAADLDVKSFPRTIDQNERASELSAQPEFFLGIVFPAAKNDSLALKAAAEVRQLCVSAAGGCNGLSLNGENRSNFGVEKVKAQEFLRGREMNWFSLFFQPMASVFDCQSLLDGEGRQFLLPRGLRLRSH